MRFYRKKITALALIAALSVSLMPDNAVAKRLSGNDAEISSMLKEADEVGQNSSQKGAAEEGATAKEAAVATEAPVVSFSQKSGTYSEAFALELTYTEPDAEIYYTTDGSDPSDPNNAGRILYTTEGITVEDKQDAPNVLSAIDPLLFDAANVKASSDNKGFQSTLEKPSDEAVDKCTVIKAAAQHADGSCSPVATNTYFIGDMKEHIEGIRESVEAAGMNLSVMSISMDADDLFDSTKGIYVKGDIFNQDLEKYLASGKKITDSNAVDVCRDLDANYKQKGKEWERKTHIDYFESNGTDTVCELQQDCGIRVQGNYSRSDYQKSFRLYARDEYGKKNFKYGFWDNAKDDAGNTIEKYKKIVLRNGGNCAFTTKFSDSYWQSLIEDIDCDKQSARPCVVYINGEYWGVYILQDDFCGAYMENKHGIDKDNILIYKGDAEAIPELGYKLDEGELPAGVTEENYYFQELEEFMRTHDDLSKEEDFNAFCELVDKESALDYFAMQVWINNKWDWPGKNWSMWKCTDAAINPANPYADGKWRFLVYDVEFGGVSGKGDSRENTVKNSNLLTTGTADKGSPNFDKPNVRCFALFMTNQGFRQEFNDRVESFSKGMFEQEHALAEAERYGKIYEPILGQFFDRFPTRNNSLDNAMNGGYASLRCITAFLDARADYIPTITKWVRKQYGDPEPGATPTATPQKTAVPSATPAAPKQTAKPTQTPNNTKPLPVNERDREIPLGDGSVKILHLNEYATKVLYTSYRVEGITYRLKSDGSFSYEAANAAKLKKKKSVIVPDIVVAGGKRYKVTEIQGGAFQGLKKLTKVTIGENVKIIGKNAFRNCKKLKQLVFIGTKLKKVNKNAFKGTAKKLKITCPNKKKKAYKNLIKKSGLKTKAFQVKKLSFKQSHQQAVSNIVKQSQPQTVNDSAVAGQSHQQNVSKKKAAKQAGKAAEETITMSSLKRADGSYDEAKSGAVVTIESAAELKMLSEYTRAEKRTEDVTFRQIADIDGTDMMMHPIGEASYEIYTDEDGESWPMSGTEYFYGTYDGGGKKISNLNILITKMDDSFDGYMYERYWGMFSQVEEATLQNINLQSIHFIDEESKETWEGDMNGSENVAGIVGHAGYNTVISNCSNYADITLAGNDIQVVGICAHSELYEIRDCHNYGDITVTGTANAAAAGISTYIWENTDGCSNAGNIHASSEVYCTASGLFLSGYAEGITACTNTGAVTASGKEGVAAGIVGKVFANGKIRSCVNSGNISAAYAGGIMQMANAITIMGCSNSGLVNGTEAAGGIVDEADFSLIVTASNTGEIKSEKKAGGIAAQAVDSRIANTWNRGDITSKNTAGGAAGRASGTEFINIWNFNKVSADVYAGGIAGAESVVENSDEDDEDDGKTMGPNQFINCIHLGTLAGEQNKGTVIAYSTLKDTLNNCYCLEGSTEPAHGSNPESAIGTVSGEGWKQQAFIDEWNQELLASGRHYALSVKYDGQNGIQWTPALVMDFQQAKTEEALIQPPVTFQVKDVSNGEYMDMPGTDGSYYLPAVAGKEYEIYRLMPDGSKSLVESGICLQPEESIYVSTPFFYVFRAYTDLKWDKNEESSKPEYSESTLYYKQYYEDCEEVSFPPVPQKNGYDFGGWYSDPGVCDEALYAALKTQNIKNYEEIYQEYILDWDDFYIDWYGDQYDTAEEFAADRMLQEYGYASKEEFELNYDEYYEKEYRVDELFEIDEDDEDEEYVWLKANTLYAKWIKKAAPPAPSPTQTPISKVPSSDGSSVYPILKNLDYYRDKPGNYVQKKGVIYKLNKKKKTAAVAGVSSKAMTSATIQAVVGADGIKYKVTAINRKAFTGCKQMKKIKVKGKNLKKVDKKALQGASKKIKIAAPAKVKKLF